MKKVLYSVVAVAAISLASCGDEWKEFEKKCVEEGAPEKTCSCMAEKLSEKYGSVSEANKAMEDGSEDAMKIAMECL